MLYGNWVKFDPNYALVRPYLATVPSDEGYDPSMRGGRTIGQAFGRMTYEPDWRSADFLSGSSVRTDLLHRTEAPYLRPPDATGGGSATFDFYSPYVLVDGAVEGEWSGTAADGLKVELRALAPKPRSAGEPDAWTPWQQLHSGPGAFRVELGRARFNPRDVSIHGAYRFQVRLAVAPNAQRKAAVGLTRLRVETAFENGIMSIPRLREGANTVRFKVADARAVQGPIRVSYRYQTAAGERTHEQVLEPKSFAGNVATYRFDAPGLVRCNSLRIQY
jgi:hypothetical protein